MSEQDIEKLLGRKMNKTEEVLYNTLKNNPNYTFIKSSNGLRAENIK